MNDSDYRTRILDLLRTRGPDKSICPSELLTGEDKQDPARMEQVRSSARQLASRDLIEFTQRGKVVDPAVAKGADPPANEARRVTPMDVTLVGVQLQHVGSRLLQTFLRAWRWIAQPERRPA